MNSGNTSNGFNGHGRAFDASDELLSAYLDGEVSDAERALVEQRLERDPAAQESLREFREISQLMHTLPHEPAPQDLYAATVKLAERHTLLGGPAIPARSLTRSRRREWLTAIAGLVATLAAVAIIPSLYWQTPSREAMLSETATTDGLDFTIAPETVTFHDRDSDMLTLAAGKTAERSRWGGPIEPDRRGTTEHRIVVAATDGHSKDSMDRRSLRGGMSISGGAAGAESAPASERPAAKPASTGMAPSTTLSRENGEVAKQAAAGDSGLERLEAWQEVQPYLNGFCQNTGAVANFDVTVIDVNEALDEFEVLLVQNGVLVTQPADELLQKSYPEKKLSGNGRDKSSAASKAEIDGSRVAMYVEADGQPITKALEEMVRRKQLLALKLQPPLQVALEPTDEESSPNDNSSNFSRNRYVVQDRKDAYWVARLAGNLSQFGEDAPVSAAEGVSNVQLAKNFQQLPGLQIANSSDASPYGNRPRLGDAADRISDLNEAHLASNYSQRVTLETPEPNWFLKVQQTSKTSLEDLAFDAQMQNGDKNSMRQLRQEFLATAPNTVRVLFVMQPAADQSGTATAAGAETTPAAPALPGRPR